MICNKECPAFRPTELFSSACIKPYENKCPFGKNHYMKG